MCCRGRCRGRVYCRVCGLASHASLCILNLVLCAGRCSVLGVTPRIVGVDGSPVDVTPEGEMLFFENNDRPGVLKRVTNLLAKAHVNIASLALSRSEGGALGYAPVCSALAAWAFCARCDALCMCCAAVFCAVCYWILFDPVLIISASALCSILSLDNKVPADVAAALMDLDDVRGVRSATITPFFIDRSASLSVEVVSGGVVGCSALCGGVCVSVSVLYELS